MIKKINEKINLFCNQNKELKTLCFITFEGIDGCGKTTISKKVFDILKEVLFDKIIWTREPGGTDLSEKIRNIIFENKMSPITEALLYSAARSEHVDKIIKPAILNNKIVLCDRFIDSSICYQGILKNVGIENIININKFATNNLNPDLIFYIDISIETSVKRINNKNSDRDTNRFDLISIEEKQQIKSSYKEIFDQRTNVIKINGENEIDVIVEEVVSIIRNILEFIKQ